MLIYNDKKEFIGIDKTYLDVFNLKNLSELIELNSDFADFFVKSPGYIHNFVHVHWIDYILCDETGVSPKVLIKIKNINYSATINIKIIFLIDSPEKESYYINLSNIKSLSEDLEEESTCEISKAFNPLEIKYDEKKTEDMQMPELDLGEQIIIEDTYEELDLQIKIVEPIKEVKDYDSYQFNPALASSELGLPVDLVIEFVQDFIMQADSFKNEFYEAVTSQDAQKSQTLSHKLKGVAANLRIQDAHEILNDINQSQDFTQIKKDIDYFYTIVTKLSNNQVKDDIVLNFKEKE